MVLALPAVLAEMFWSAELLVALGSTFGVVLDLDLTTGIVISAAVVTLYTMAGGMWAVAYTDAFQLLLVIVGLAVALPYALSAAGGISHAWSVYQAAPHAPALSSVSWWDVSIMLMLGGVPWNCYFQRVLSCRSPRAAQAHSILSGFATIALTIPPLLMGLVAFAYVWPPALADRLAAQPADALPLIFKLCHAAGDRPARPRRDRRRRHVELLLIDPVGGLDVRVECVAGVCSSRTCRSGGLTFVMRLAIATLGVGAVWMALEVQSVQALWFFTSDLVFVLLFPQLVAALFDRKANLLGSIAAFSVSLVLRLGGGEPLFGIPALIPYPEWWPFKTIAAGAGMILLPAGVADDRAVERTASAQGADPR